MLTLIDVLLTQKIKRVVRCALCVVRCACMRQSVVHCVCMRQCVLRVVCCAVCVYAMCCVSFVVPCVLHVSAVRAQAGRRARQLVCQMATGSRIAAAAVHGYGDPVHGMEQRSLFVYFDYHGVLNSGQSLDYLEEMNEFLVGVDHINYDVRIILLSKGSSYKRRKSTLDDLANAGVLDLFDNIVFTSDKTIHESREFRGENTATEYLVYDQSAEETRRADDGLPYCYHEFVKRFGQSSWDSARGSSLESTMLRFANYEFFWGGKDQYIRDQHANRKDIAIAFVDDKAEIVEAVFALNPRAHCIEMRRHCFRTDAAVHKHVRNFKELHDAILALLL